jgi:hypothetical protein
VLWSVIFESTREHSDRIAKICSSNPQTPSSSHFVCKMIERLLEIFQDTPGKSFDTHIAQALDDEQFKKAKGEVLKLSAKCPVIIAIDTLEKYNIDSDALMNAMAALIQCAADFSLTYRNSGIHIKTFISGEIFPYLKEDVLQNPSKSIKKPVYLLWRPKDLLRLISWRYYCHLKESEQLLNESIGSINWEDPNEVMQKMWLPYFGSEITNSRGLKESTFAYVLRHTQMRPRQLILMCNQIAKLAVQEKCFPRFSENGIRLAVREAENDLAGEIINSFSTLYPEVGTIVDALIKMPMIFTGNELDKRASETASEWPPGMYSPARFRRLVAELGIVGKVRRHNEKAGYIDADFEYSLRDRLPITHRDECVIHPMFYRRLDIELNTMSRVMPFSTDRDTREANGDFS